VDPLEPISIQVRGIVEFHKNVFTPGEVYNQNLQTKFEDPVNVFFIPSVFNQGGFDLAYITEQDGKLIMVFLQVIRQISHTIKIDYFYNFLDSYNCWAPAGKKISNIIIQLVVPFDTRDNYSPPSPSDVIGGKGSITRSQAKNTPPIVVAYGLLAFKKSGTM
jgi:hypothetical protein